MATTTQSPRTERDTPTAPNPTSWRLELTVAILGVLVGLAAVLLFVS